MNLFTEVKIPKSNINLSYKSKLMFVGSCFADNISAYFTNAKFSCLSNPFGTLYNPISINTLFDMIINRKEFVSDDFFYSHGMYSSYMLHSDLSNKDIQTAVANTNKALTESYNYLQQTSILFITLGTAWVYYLNANGKEVANCHKQNPKLFTRKLLTVEESAAALHKICTNVLSINPDIRIVLTVSPIRHIADGATDNSLSKSTLLLSINQIVNAFANVEYFPSYEIMIDELRDYRFYEDNLTHPSKLAEQIIFEKLLSSFCSKVVVNQTVLVEHFMKSANHKIISPESLEANLFAKAQLQRAMQLESQIAGLDLSNEKQYFTEIVNNNKTNQNE
ncbi:MAG: GSCFA domain-containing protein [Bacteroidales bacterium]|nr:GSCFA domain-containing protein [Bacteroidales bacterium]